MGFRTAWVGWFQMSVLQGFSEWPCGVKPLLSAVEISLMTCFLWAPFPSPLPNWCFLESGPTQTIPKLLSWFSFWENSNWDNKIGMEKQWQCLLEVAWSILDGKSKEKRGGQSLQELKETDSSWRPTGGKHTQPRPRWGTSTPDDLLRSPPGAL